MVMEFARRGFRLFLTHQDPEFLSTCRSSLRTQGLQSQLMGSHELRKGVSLSLARHFYDIFVFCHIDDATAARVVDWLGPGATVVFPKGSDEIQLHASWGEVDSTMHKFRLFRMGS